MVYYGSLVVGGAGCEALVPSMAVEVKHGVESTNWLNWYGVESFQHWEAKVSQ